MLRGEFDAAAADGPADLRAEYESVLAETIERLGVETVAERSGLASGTVEAVLAGESPELTLSEAAAVLAADEGRPDAEAIAAEARDVLLLGMTAAVVDVDALASALDGALEAKELQQKVEGRHPMTLAEYATVHYELGEHTD